MRCSTRSTICIFVGVSVSCVALASCTSFGADPTTMDAGSAADAARDSLGSDAADAPAVSAYAASVLADQPLLYWRLGEADGQRAVDSSTSMRDGDHQTSGVLLGQPSLLARDPNPSTRITAGSSITRKAEAALSFPTSRPFAVECWLKLPSKPSATAVIVARMQDDKELLSGYSLRVEGDGRVYFQRGEGTQVSVASTSELTVNIPHHVVGVFDGTAIRLFVDGAEQTFSNQGLGLDDRALDFTVGRYATGTAKLDAFVDEVAVYGYALPADRVKAHFDNGAGP